MSPVFRHGRLRLYLLRLLDEEPRHGYEVIRLLRDRFMGVYAPSPGTIYPRLARLEEEGLVTHDEVDGRKVYRITDAGRQELHEPRATSWPSWRRSCPTSVRDIVREVKEDVRETVRSLREELTAAARNARPPEGADEDVRGSAPHRGRTGPGAGPLEPGRRPGNGSGRPARRPGRAPAASATTRGGTPGPNVRRSRAGHDRDGSNWASWADWPGRRGFPGKPDVRLLHDLEHTVKDFAREMRRLAWQSSAEAGEDALTELRIILDETLDRVRSEIFGSEHPQPESPEPEPRAGTPGEKPGPSPESPASGPAAATTGTSPPARAAPDAGSEG